jgi:hypothetical protein
MFASSKLNAAGGMGALLGFIIIVQIAVGALPAGRWPFAVIVKREEAPKAFWSGILIEVIIALVVIVGILTS